MRFHVRYKPIWSKLQLQPGFLWKKSLTDWPLLEWPCVTKGLNLGRPMWHAKKNAKGFLRIMNAAEKGGSIYDFEPRTVTRTTIPGEWYSIATKMIPACCVRGDAQEFKYVGPFFANDEGEASKMRWFLLRPFFLSFCGGRSLDGKVFFSWSSFCTLTWARPATMMFEKIRENTPSSAKIFLLSDGNLKKHGQQDHFK